MKALLTGAGGQLGRCLQDRCPADWQLLALDHRALNITDSHAVGQCVRQFQPELIINAAAYTRVDQAEREPAIAYAANEEGPRHIAQAARAIGARLIHLSTDYVFDGHSARPYVETDLAVPLNVYGRSKLAGENAVLRDPPGPEAEPRAIVLRTSWLYSEYGNNFVKTIVQRILLGQVLSVVDDQVGAPTYAGDLADAIIQIARMPGAKGGLYHYSGTEALSWHAFAVKVIEAVMFVQNQGASPPRPNSTEAAKRAQGTIGEGSWPKPVSSEQYPAVAVRPRYSVLDSHKIQKLGISPSAGMDTHLRTIAALLLGGRVRGSQKLGLFR
ncbi:dTDP-4-dehydrorhamnose reductase [Paralcaligenes sp. KSB-10]|uniref:dTDP-4-dehydrorhamnose reductase n=1 Tax=Paralcaligenes sp. KSB-10 TaxID=2901142 RepID=UPI001E3057AB|nr:dTDP-4-dehydrorhamnose reductase [Paralcaligenes sp. KSB-10]UHL63257.1 dTDP-4-dehydrorhamnose reductase [Paralcaligenes sp. KSB-10]